MKTIRTILSALIFGLAISGLAYAADKAFPSGMSALTTPAADDYLLISDTSASAESKKITYADLFDTPPNNAVAIGGASNGFTSAYFTNGTATGAIKYSGNTLQFGSTSAHNIQLLASTANVGLTTGKEFYPGGTGYTLGTNSTSTAWQVAYFTNGTVKGFLSAGAAGFGVGTLTNHNLRWAVDTEGTEEAITLNTSGHFYPAAATQTLGLTGTTNGWNAAYFTNGTATGAIKYSTNTLQIGSTTDHAVKILQNNAASIVLDPDGRPIFKAPASAIADSGLAASQLSMYLDESGGAEKLIIKAKLSGGTVKTFTINAD